MFPEWQSLEGSGPRFVKLEEARKDIKGVRHGQPLAVTLILVEGGMEPLLMTDIKALLDLH